MSCIKITVDFFKYFFTKFYFIVIFFFCRRQWKKIQTLMMICKPNIILSIDFHVINGNNKLRLYHHTNKSKPLAWCSLHVGTLYLNYWMFDRQFFLFITLMSSLCYLLYRIKKLKQTQLHTSIFLFVSSLLGNLGKK